MEGVHRAGKYAVMYGKKGDELQQEHLSFYLPVVFLVSRYHVGKNAGRLPCLHTTATVV